MQQSTNGNKPNHGIKAFATIPEFEGLPSSTPRPSTPASFTKKNSKNYSFENEGGEGEEGYTTTVYNTFALETNGSVQYTHSPFTSRSIGYKIPNSVKKPSQTQPQRILIAIAIVFIIVAVNILINQYQIRRHSNDIDDLLQKIEINQNMTENMEQQNNAYNHKINRINMTTQSIKENADNLQDKIRRNIKGLYTRNDVDDLLEQQRNDILMEVQRNTVEIYRNKMNITENMQNVTTLKDAMKHKADNSMLFDINQWFENERRTNWISGVIAKPQTIPYSFNDHGTMQFLEGSENKKKKKPDNLWSAIVRGSEIWHEQMVGNNDKEKNKNDFVGNVDITDSATSSTLRPNDCLQFATETKSRWIEVSLMEKMIPFEFEYIHIDKAKLAEKDRNKSPKRFRFFGKVRGGKYSQIEVEEDKILKVNESSLRLRLNAKNGVEIMKIEYDVNDDATMTRIYRMRIHAET